MTTEEAKKLSARHTRRSFLVAAAAAAAGFEFYHYLRTAPGDEMIARPMREALNFNAALSRAVFDERGLAPTYDVSKSKDLRINGNYGLKQDLLLPSYRLQVVGSANAKAHPKYVPDVTTWDYQYKTEEAAYAGHDTKEAPKQGPAPDVNPLFAKAMKEYMDARGNKPIRGNEEAGESDSTLDPGTPGLLLTMEDLTQFPHQDFTTQFKCIEGWSEIVHWGGYRLADFMEAYPPARNDKGEYPRYVYMETPNGDFYTSYDMKDCRHPQSTLVTEMAGKPISQAHGAPVRLHMPIKYGYKQIKRIGLIAYTDQKPDDYWTKLGYDWYAGL
jgi:hypothetical protein